MLTIGKDRQSETRNPAVFKNVFELVAPRLNVMIFDAGL
jgi:hypothetical protein